MRIPKIYTRQELVNELLRFERENGRIPRRDDIASTSGYPPIKRYYGEFGSFTNALEATPFVTRKVIFYTKDLLISEALRYEEESGKVPSYSDIQKADGYPPISAYLNEFGLWSNVLIEVPFKNKEEIVKREVKIYTDQELKDLLLKRYDELGRIPEGDDMEVNLGYPCVDVYYLRFGSFSSVKDEVFYNKEWLKQYLLKVRRKLGRIPRARDMVESKGFIPVTRFIKPFCSWGNAIRETFYTPENIQREFLKFEKENGRTPTTFDFQHAKGQIPYHRVEKVYGTWRKSKYETPFETTIDHTFFSPENMNLRKWYIVGYIIGDGNISITGCLNVRTTEKDNENLYDMYNYMKIDSKIRFDIKSENQQDSYSFTKYSPKWIEDLKLYGIVPRKSKREYIPLDYLKIQEEAAICRGLFDADGGIHFRKGRTLIRIGSLNNSDNFIPVFFMCSASRQLCVDYAFLLKKNCNIDCNIYKHGSIFRIQIIGKEKCQKIYNFLYGHENFYIKRKKERFKKLLNGTFTKETDPYFVS